MAAVAEQPPRPGGGPRRGPRGAPGRAPSARGRHRGRGLLRGGDPQCPLGTALRDRAASLRPGPGGVAGRSLQALSSYLDLQNRRAPSWACESFAQLSPSASARAPPVRRHLRATASSSTPSCWTPSRTRWRRPECPAANGSTPCAVTSAEWRPAGRSISSIRTTAPPGPTGAGSGGRASFTASIIPSRGSPWSAAPPASRSPSSSPGVRPPRGTATRKAPCS